MDSEVLNQHLSRIETHWTALFRANEGRPDEAAMLAEFNRIKEVVPWFKSSYQLRLDDKKQTEIPVSRAQTKRLRELFGL